MYIYNIYIYKTDICVLYNLYIYIYLLYLFVYEVLLTVSIWDHLYSKNIHKISSKSKTSLLLICTCTIAYKGGRMIVFQKILHTCWMDEPYPYC